MPLRSLTSRATSPSARLDVFRFAKHCLRLGTAVLLLSGCSRSHRVYPAFPEAEHPLRSVAIIPLQVSLRTQAIGSFVGAPGESQESFRRKLLESMQTTLLSYGIQSAAPFDGPEVAATPLSAIAEAAVEHNKALADIAFLDDKEWLEDRQPNPPLECVLSEAMPELASRLHVDAVMLVSLSAVERSASGYSLEVLRSALITLATGFIDTTLPHRFSVSGDVLLVDGTSGRALFFNSIEGSSADPQDESDLSELSQKLLSPLAAVISRGSSAR